MYSIRRRGSWFLGKVKIDQVSPLPGIGYAHWGSPLEALEGVAMTLRAVS